MNDSGTSGDEHRYIVYSVEGNRQRLDGGAMFGNAPKALWSRWVTADEQNRIDLACRAFLIVDRQAQRRILLETGIGAFFEPELRERYGVGETQHVLLESLRAREVAPEAIDWVVLSHLHFDHAGGLLRAWRAETEPALVFPNARFVVSEVAWLRAQQPHPRDRASFIPALVELLRASGRLEIVGPGAPHPLGDDFSYTLSDGHTPGQLLTELSTQHGGVVLSGDLVPGLAWMRAAITLGYDRYPELLIDEKRAFLERARERNTRLLLTHDAEHASTTVAIDARGRFVPGDTQTALDRLLL